MNHTRYEDWLIELSEAPLEPEQAAALEAHLRECENCSSLAESWGQVERTLRKAGQVAPAPGFGGRWQARLAQDRQRQHRRQTVLVIGAGALALLIFTVLLGTLAWPWLRSPGLLLWAWVYQVVGIYLIAATTGEVLLPMVGSLFAAVPLLVWVFIFGLASMLSVLWVVSYRMLTNPRRMMK
jgi:hypothetical protein